MQCDEIVNQVCLYLIFRVDNQAVSYDSEAREVWPKHGGWFLLGGMHSRVYTDWIRN